MQMLNSKCQKSVEALFCFYVWNGGFVLAKGSSSVAVTVRGLLEGEINAMGYRVWDVEYVKEGATWYLRITIDSDNGIDINDCEKVHRAIDPLLDEADPIQDAYYLEVSSPGIERELRTDEHITLSIGSKVEAKLFSQKNGRKSYTGILESFDEGGIVILENEEKVVLEKSEIAKLTTVYFE